LPKYFDRKLGLRILPAYNFGSFGFLLLILLVFFGALGFSRWLWTNPALFILKKIWDRTGWEKKLLLPVARVTSFSFLFFLLSIFDPSACSCQRRFDLGFWWFSGTLKPLLITLIFLQMVNVLASFSARLANQNRNLRSEINVSFDSPKTLKSFCDHHPVHFFYTSDGLTWTIIPFLTGLSIGGCCIALARHRIPQKLLLARLMIFMTSPFQVGDWITPEI